jgi:hypothetical protein
MEFRLLRADEIEARIARITNYSVSILLYKDARCDMRILDETVGPENWQRNHEVINGNLFCNVGILTENGWVWKQDVGTESYTEATKGEASDSFKRACFNWGIGRELYTAPKIDFKTSECKVKDGKCYDRFRVDEIQYDDNRITRLVVTNLTTFASFVWEREEKTEETYATEAEMNTIEAVCKKKGKSFSGWLKQIGKTKDTVTGEEAGKMLRYLNGLEDKA